MLMVRCAEHGAQKQRCFYYHSHANTLHCEQAPLTQVHRPVRGNTDGRAKASSKMLAVREIYPTSRGGTIFFGTFGGGGEGKGGGRDLHTLGARDSVTEPSPRHPYGYRMPWPPAPRRRAIYCYSQPVGGRRRRRWSLSICGHRASIPPAVTLAIAYLGHQRQGIPSVCGSWQERRRRVDNTVASHELPPCHVLFHRSLWPPAPQRYKLM